MKTPISLSKWIAVSCSLLLCFQSFVAAADVPSTPAPAPEQLDSLVAPIALYPDPLLSQVLVATTYPLEIVQASQWVQQHTDLQGQALVQAAQQQGWDPSVQALVVFPDLLKRLAQDVTWTTNIGNAFLAHQSEVMDAVQRMRYKAEQAGKLQSTEQQRVTTTNQGGQPVVEIEPTNPQVIYVPYYDPVVVWGPPVYYPYPYWYFPPPPRPDIVFWFGPPIFLGALFIGCCGWGGWGWGPVWSRRTIIVNNTFIRRYNFVTRENVWRGPTHVWAHDPVHRMGVAYPNRGLNERFHAEPRFHPTVFQVRSQVRDSAVRFRSTGPTERFGNREIESGGFNRNRSAFGGVEPGTNARMHSDRGFSSMGRARMGTPAPVQRSGGVNGGHGGFSGGRGGSSVGHGGEGGGRGGMGSGSGGGWGGNGGGGWGGGHH